MTLADRIFELRQWKGRFGPGQAEALEALLRQAAGLAAGDAASLIQLHEIALYLRAYPASPEVLRLCEEILAGFGERLREFERAGGDLAPFEEPEVSGIAGSRLSAVFSHGVARHLAARHPGSVRIDWDRYEETERLASTLPLLVPLLDDDALVEPAIGWREWMEAAAGGRDLAWLLEGIEKLEGGERRQADRYQTLRLPLTWDFGDSGATRTRMRLPAGDVFYHTEPLLRRQGISLDETPALPPLPARKLEREEGARMLDLARDTSAARYRELHGFTYGAPDSVWEIDAGRGVRFYLSGLREEHRLPLRAYHAATIWKNGVPIGYFEALSLAERMEAGFNLYYTFREGETAWLYRQLLRMFHQFLGVTCIWLDPYQIGHENPEAIHSGAFWFYRKLGFRSVSPQARRLTAREEKRLAARPGYRSSAATLRRLVEHPMVYEFPGTEQGAWDRFETRRLGLAAARGAAGARRLAGAVTAMKAAADDVEYLRRLRAHPTLRRELIRIGSAPADTIASGGS